MNLSPDANGTVALAGDLTFDTAGAVYRATPTLDRAVTAVALGGLGRVDSAGLALLLEWQSTATAQGRHLLFSDAPDDLVRLAALCEADDLLGITRETAQGEDHKGSHHESD